MGQNWRKTEVLIWVDASLQDELEIWRDINKESKNMKDARYDRNKSESFIPI